MGVRSPRNEASDARGPAARLSRPIESAGRLLATSERMQCWRMAAACAFKRVGLRPPRLHLAGLASCLPFIASIGACGGARGTSNDESTAEQQFYAQLEGVVCAVQAQCCEASGYTPGRCTVPYGYGYPADPAEGALGEVLVPSAEAPCLATIRQALTSASSYCAAGQFSPPSQSSLIAMCPGLYAGGSYHTVPLGGACADGDYPGLSDSRCAPSDDGESRCATWTTTTSEGTTSWSGCIDVVDVGAMGDVCGAADREDASLLAAPTTLRAARSCGSGLYCAPSFTCLPQATALQACAGAGSCSDGLTCDPTASLCIPLSEAGGPCAPDGACAADAACDAHGVCVPPLGQGAACGQQPVPCASGLQCTSDSTCQPPPAVVGLGASCDGVTTTCSSGAYCNAAAGACVALRASGAACDGGDQCMSGQCYQGGCTPPPAPVIPSACTSAT
jgi:hypothetical protein